MLIKENKASRISVADILESTTFLNSFLSSNTDLTGRSVRPPSIAVIVTEINKKVDSKLFATRSFNGAGVPVVKIFVSCSKIEAIPAIANIKPTELKTSSLLIFFKNIMGNISIITKIVHSNEVN